MMPLRTDEERYLFAERLGILMDGRPGEPTTLEVDIAERQILDDRKRRRERDRNSKTVRR